MATPMSTDAMEDTPTVLLRNIASGRIASSFIRHSCQKKPIAPSAPMT